MSDLRSRADLARELESVVTAVPGVVMLFPAQSAPVVAVVSLVSRVAGAEAPPLVAVSGSGEAVSGEVPGAGPAGGPAVDGDAGAGRGGLTVAVTIGVSEDVSAAETCRAVYASIAEHLAGAGLGPARSISVLVGAIT